MTRTANKLVAGDLQRYVRLLSRMTGNRRGPRRLPVFGTIYVKGSSYAIEYTCACFDISPRGIGIESAGPMTVGSFVTVYAGERGPRRLACVRYCHRAPETFRVGLEFAGEALVRFPERRARSRPC